MFTFKTSKTNPLNDDDLPEIMTEDVLWKQRFDNYSKALRQLTRFMEKG